MMKAYLVHVFDIERFMPSFIDKWQRDIIKGGGNVTQLGHKPVYVIECPSNSYLRRIFDRYDLLEGSRR